MYKSLKSIILLIIITLASFLLFYLFTFQTLSTTSYDAQYSNSVDITPINEDFLQVSEKVIANVDGTNVMSLSFPISIYKDDFEKYTSSLDITDINININGKQILTKNDITKILYQESIMKERNLTNSLKKHTELYKNVNKDIVYSYGYNRMSISNYTKAYFQPGEYVITLTYKCKINDVITNYSNIGILKLKRNTKFSNLDVNLKLPIPSVLFKVNSKKVNVVELSDNTYNLNLSKIKTSKNIEHVNISFDNDIFSNAKNIDEYYSESNETKIFNNENISNLIYFFIILTITIIIFISTLILTKKTKIEKRYLRDVEGIISPILAESLIDRKMGAKQLIMTLIVDLVSRGNIENIDNDKFKLISKENLIDYEEQLVDLLFGYNKIISFCEINEMFINNNSNTSNFVKELKSIKKKILDKLFDLNLYCKSGKKVLNFIQTISILVYANILALAKFIIYDDYYDISTIIILNFFSCLIYYSFKVPIKTSNRHYKKSGSGFKILLSFSFLVLASLVLLVLTFAEHAVLFILLFILLILNTITILKTKLYILTPKGKEEYEKVCALKSYIVDYSLMKERDVDGTIIWDKYLAYAVAFSIPNKITNKFNEALMQSNIVLQKIDNFIKS